MVAISKYYPSSSSSVQVQAWWCGQRQHHSGKSVNFGDIQCYQLIMLQIDKFWSKIAKIEYLIGQNSVLRENLTIK